MYETGSSWEVAAEYRKLNLELCDNLEGWDGEENGREVWERRDMVVPMANSC